MFTEIKKLIKNYLIYSMGSIANKAIGLIMIPVYTHYIKPAEYGVLQILNMTIWIIVLIFGFNMQVGVVRFYYDYKLKSEKDQIIITGLLFNIIVAGILCGITYFFAGPFSKDIFQSHDYTVLFKIAFLTMFFDMAIAVPFATLRIINKAFLFTVLSVLQLIVGLSLNIYFIVFLKEGILGILYSSLYTSMLMSMLLIPMVFKWFGFRTNLQKLKDMLKYTSPLIISSLSMFVLNLGDRYLLKYFCNLSDVGIYSLGYTMVTALGILIATPFMNAWDPQRFALHGQEDASRYYSKVFTYFFLLMTFAATLLSTVSKDLLAILTSGSYQIAYRIIPLVALGYVFSQSYYLISIGIHLTKKTKWAPIIVTTAAASNIIANIYLIPRYGMMGAAWATLFSYLLLAIFGYFVSQRLYYIPYEYLRLAKVLSVGLIIYFISLPLGIGSAIFSTLAKTLLVFSFPFMLYAFNFFEPEEVSKLKYIIRKAYCKLFSIKDVLLLENEP